MRCSKCRQEYDSEYAQCPVCGHQEDSEVRILSPEEKLKYDGITIESDGTGYDESKEQKKYYSNEQRVYIKKVHLGNSKWISKLTFYFFLAAVIAFLVFFIVPTALVAIGVGALVWLVLRFIR